eukprot:TRINITY_DN1618_c0_g6_i1.p1 TRINITY_DN1618_c0_g6~~TRINITY_DN1618_c0_g6_i1.p1  ORF type:complete len:213 (-),score=19.40 TRINITY_DN1618_c0_g6_i1:189-827(-)
MAVLQCPLTLSQSGVFHPLRNRNHEDHVLARNGNFLSYVIGSRAALLSYGIAVRPCPPFGLGVVDEARQRSFSVREIAFSSRSLSSRRHSNTVVVFGLKDGGGEGPTADRPDKSADLQGSPASRPASGPVVMELPLGLVRRPLQRLRSNDPAKVQQLMDSIREIGLQEPIDVLDIGGVFYGFSGCHRFEAHQRLGLATIKCRVRRGTDSTLR